MPASIVSVIAHLVRILEGDAAKISPLEPGEPEPEPAESGRAVTSSPLRPFVGYPASKVKSCCERVRQEKGALCSS